DRRGRRYGTAPSSRTCRRRTPRGRWSRCSATGRTCGSRSERAAEGVAPGRLAAPVAAVEPLLTLCGGSVGPRLRVHAPLRRLLDAVVADGRGRVESLVHVLLGEVGDVAGRNGVPRPDAGVAVGLQLGADGAALRPLRGPRAERAEQVLRVVPVLVRDHVRLGERAALCAEAIVQLLVEAEVDVDVLVRRTVERPDVRRRGAAARRGGAGEEDRPRDLVALAVRAEPLLPVGLDAVHVGEHAAVLPLVEVGVRAVELRAGARAGAGGHAVEAAERAAPAAAEHGDEQVDDDADEAEAAAADRDRPAAQAAHAAAV